MTVDEMDDVIQNYCDGKDCNTCVLRNICLPLGGDFISNPDVCEEAYKIIKSVDHPSYYNKGKIEVADFIADQKLNFDRGNAVKYVCRAGSKDPEKEIQDLEKAIWYINHEIKMLKGETDNGTEKET